MQMVVVVVDVFDAVIDHHDDDDADVVDDRSQIFAVY